MLKVSIEKLTIFEFSCTHSFVLYTIKHINIVRSDFWKLNYSKLLFDFKIDKG